MTTCPSCKVELTPGTTACPLCGARSISDRDAPDDRCEPEKTAGSIIDPDNESYLNATERRTVAGEVLTVSATIASVSVAIVDVVTSGRLSWSLYPLASIAFAWCCAALPVLLYGKPGLLTVSLATALPLFLLALDIIDGELTWFIPLALPLATALELSAAMAALAIRLCKRRGLNIVAFIVLSVTVACLSLETIIDLFNDGTIQFDWATIVASALMPIAVFLLYLHARIGRTTSLRKLFRI